jgi:hypothetical protein
MPDDWASTQNNLGIALRMLGEREGATVRLKEAASVLRAVLEVRTSAKMPVQTENTQKALALVEGLLSKGRNSVHGSHEIDHQAAEHQSVPRF